MTLVQPQIINLGFLSKITDHSHIDQNKVWSGNISLKNRSEKIQEQAKLVLTEEYLQKYFVTCDLMARSQCIDGRYSDQPFVGPKVPGGTPGAAVAHRIVDLDGAVGKSTIESDLTYILGRGAGNRIAFGAHIDDHTQGQKTGCGAIDRMPEILKKFSQFEANPQMRYLVKALLGDNYSSDTHNLLLGRLINLQSHKDQYLIRNTDGEYAYRRRVIDSIRENADNTNPIEKLIGPHNEIALAINTVAGTTFDRDRFSQDHKHELQIFNYDFWRTQQVAGMLYPIQINQSTQEQYIMIRERNEFITFRAMYAVATAMVLTDGSIPLLVRKEV